MDLQQTFRLFSCLVCLCQYELTWQWHGEELQIYDSIELAVTGEDMKECKDQNQVCVSDSKDCKSVNPHRTDVFLNTTCRYFVHKKSFVCNWIYLNDTKIKMTNSFIFTQPTEFSHCPSIFNLLAEFNLTIKSMDAINKIEVFSQVYEISIETITQAPRPKVTSVTATETSLTVTWTSECQDVECHYIQIRYKQSTVGEWTEVSVSDSDTFHVIRGLQPFSRYSLTVACSLGYGLQSDWSEEFEGMTLEAVPTAAPNVTYCVETLDPGLRTQKLLLVWRALEVSEACGVILGYKVTYASTSEPSPKTIITTDLKAELVVAEGVYNVTLMAYNSVGQSPVRHVRINTGLGESLPRVRHLWASAEGDSLRIWWEIETAAASMREFAIEWFSFGDAASKQWKRVDGTTFSTVLTEHIKQSENYSISVYHLSNSLCGPPASVQANLESGILLDIDQLRVVNMTKSSVMVRWMWQRKAPGTSILRYRLTLIGANKTTSFIIFPHQWQHTFSHLQTNVKYSLYIYGETGSGNLSKAFIEFMTPLENDEIVKVAVPILLLIAGLGIFSVLSRTVYKEYFFPNIANPGHSLIGHWLLNPLTGTTVSVFKPEDIPLNTEKCLMQMEPLKSMEVEGVDEDILLSELDLLDVCLLETSDSGESSQVSPGLTEYVDLPFLPDHFGYVENCHSPASVS